MKYYKNKIYTVWVDQDMVHDKSEESAKKIFNKILMDLTFAQKATNVLIVRIKTVAPLYDDSDSADILGIYTDDGGMTIQDILSESIKIYLGVEELSEEMQKFVTI